MTDLERTLKEDLYEAYKTILAEDNWINDQGCGVKNCVHCGNYFYHYHNMLDTIDHKPTCIVLKARKALAN